MPMNDVCPCCGTREMRVFYKLDGVPVHSVLLLSTREEALDYPGGEIALAFCQHCGFIWNAAFDTRLQEYSGRYEATQAFSPTFNAFARHLAQRLIDRYDLHGKDIIEIGCGQGEFLVQLCELGGNRGVGFDPAYVGRRDASEGGDRVTFVSDFYSEQYAGYRADFVCCKMTLEHIQYAADFVSTLRRSLGECSDTVVFFQVPDVTRILRGLAFWDIYYEHCSYFSPGSLARLFRRCGFDVISLARAYDDQYLMIEARPGDGRTAPDSPDENDLESLARGVDAFSSRNPGELDAWWRELEHIRQRGQRAVIWGAGSKGVAFLTTLKIRDQVAYAVDINPHKRGTYMAGTGQEIVAPEFLETYRPEHVIVMNPVYCDEIRQTLDRMGIPAQLLPV